MNELVGIETSEWASTATFTARQEVARMISAAVTHLFKNIGEGISFAPFAVIIKHDGELYLNIIRTERAEAVSELVASPVADEMAQEDVGFPLSRDPCAQALYWRARDAGSISKGRDSGRLPVLRLVGDHRESSPFVAAAPWWQEQDGQFTRGTLQVAPGPIALFGSPGERPHSHAIGSHSSAGQIVEQVSHASDLASVVIGNAGCRTPRRLPTW